MNAHDDFVAELGDGLFKACPGLIWDYLGARCVWSEHALTLVNRSKQVCTPAVIKSIRGFSRGDKTPRVALALGLKSISLAVSVLRAETG